MLTHHDSKDQYECSTCSTTFYLRISLFITTYRYDMIRPVKKNWNVSNARFRE